MTFSLQGVESGEIDVVLPRNDWQCYALYTLPIVGDGKWRKVRIDLEKDFKLAECGITRDNLRGELFFSNPYPVNNGTPRGACAFLIADLSFE